MVKSEIREKVTGYYPMLKVLKDKYVVLFHKNGEGTVVESAQKEVPVGTYLEGLQQDLFSELEGKLSISNEVLACFYQDDYPKLVTSKWGEYRFVVLASSMTTGTVVYDEAGDAVGNYLPSRDLSRYPEFNGEIVLSNEE